MLAHAAGPHGLRHRQPSVVLDAHLRQRLRSDAACVKSNDKPSMNNRTARAQCKYMSFNNWLGAKLLWMPKSPVWGGTRNGQGGEVRDDARVAVSVASWQERWVGRVAWMCAARARDRTDARRGAQLIRRR